MDESIQKHLTELDEASRLLLKAADVLEKGCWCQGEIGWGSFMCLGGAIYTASLGHIPEKVEKLPDYASIAFARMNTATGGSLAVWNDKPGRTKEEVVAKLRAVALGG